MNTSRFLDIFNPADHKHKAIIIIGCGNIGSHLAIAIARLGFEKFILFDSDIVEEPNVATQYFNNEDIDMPKVEALRKHMLNINNDIDCCTNEHLLKPEMLMDTIIKNELLNPSDILTVISAVDSIKIRDAIKKLLSDDPVTSDVPVIDGRIGFEQVEVLFADSPQNWDVNVNDEKIIHTPCGQKYVPYTPILCAALMSDTVKKLAMSEYINKKLIFEFKNYSFLKYT